MNIVVLIGRLTSDPSLTFSQNSNTAVASFRLAVDRETQEGADFIQCKVFGKQAENLQKYKHKGDEVAVSGRIQTGSYKNREGKTVYTTDVVCNKIKYTHGSKNERSEARAEYTDPDVKQMADAELPDSFAQFDEDVPF